MNENAAPKAALSWLLSSLLVRRRVLHLDQRGMGGDAQPLAVQPYPGVGEASSVVERLTLVCSLVGVSLRHGNHHVRG